MRRHISRYVQATAGGERTRHFTAKQPPGIRVFTIYWSWDSDTHWLRPWRVGKTI